MLSWWRKSNLIKVMTITLERYGEPTWIFNATGGLSIRGSETGGHLGRISEDDLPAAMAGTLKTLENLVSRN